ncbi:Sec-independent protein translocase protein TatB [Marinimicrobium alkaliphilum]|uniref:Sec-independent protein translocase protein TatB n=1 Tax=Marinimicrobium alkaliphilum TaxID=2202654 RepID=UPI000DB9019B|nr:Sec-independent protein translocase protein TatB [Marinimicrobium alkaliphilum]
MFDIGFFELMIIAVIGLLVIGPERLPEAARAVGLWVGRVKRSLTETRSEIERQIGADDIRRQLHNENVMRSLERTRQQMEESVRYGIDSLDPGLHSDTPKKASKAEAPEPVEPDETSEKSGDDNDAPKADDKP